MSGVEEVTGENNKNTCIASNVINTQYDHVKAEHAVNNVVASGSTPNTLQLPSPVYFALFIDDTHVILGAGGGGHRFGMANVLALIEIDTRSSPTSHDVLNNEVTSKTGKANSTTNESYTKEQQVHSLWTYCCALDLESDVPWCTSSFIHLENTAMKTDATPESHAMKQTKTSLSHKAQTSKESSEDYIDAVTEKLEDQGKDAVECTFTNNTTKALIGYFAVSSISCFLLIGVYESKLQLHTTLISKSDSKPSFDMSVLARVALPNDKRNPDKKPISIIHDAFVTVAHDENGVCMYNFRSLIQQKQKKKLRNLNKEINEESKSKYSGNASVIATDNNTTVNEISDCKKKEDGIAVDNELTCTRKYVPFANWMVETRLNDLHTNRFYSVKTKIVQNEYTRHESNVHNASDTNKSNDAANEETHASKRVMCKALVRHYCLIAALGQDKTIKLAALRLPVTESEWTEIELISQEELEYSEPQTRHVIELQTIATLGSVDYKLPFTPLTSSLRIIQLFGLENLDTEKENCQAIHSQYNNEELTEAAAKRALTLATLQYEQHIHEKQKEKEVKEAKEISLEEEQHESVKECVTTSDSSYNDINENTEDLSVNATEFDDKVIVSSLVVVAFDARQNKSYMLTGQVLMSLEDATHESTNGEVQSAKQNCRASTNICTSSSSRKLQQTLPSLSVQMSSCSSFIVDDCITCITPVVKDSFMKYHEVEDNSKVYSSKDTEKHEYSEHETCGSGSISSNSKLINNSNVLCEKTSPLSSQITQSNFLEFCEKRAVLAKCTGTCLPRCWLAGTVDGTVALIELHKEANYHTLANTQHFALRATRPVSGTNAKRMTSNFPALHSEPISGIALSSLNDVVTTDIAQHVVLTTLPLIEQSQHQEYKENCKKQEKEELERRRSRDAVPLFPSSAFGHNVDSSNSNNINDMLSIYRINAGYLLGSPKAFILFVISVCVIIIAFIMH